MGENVGSADPGQGSPLISITSMVLQWPADKCSGRTESVHDELATDRPRCLRFSGVNEGIKSCLDGIPLLSPAPARQSRPAHDRCRAAKRNSGTSGSFENFAFTESCRHFGS